MNSTAPSYYSLAELFVQRMYAETFGMDSSALDIEIDAMQRYVDGLPVPTRPFDWAVD